MGFLTSLFGGTGNTVVTVVLALGIVLVLIVLGLWALKMLFNATNSVGRGRNRRLSLIDSTAIDSKRQLILVRRDNVEHLLMVGGAQDLVVETGIEPPAEPEPVKRPKRRIVPAPVVPAAEANTPAPAPAPTPAPEPAPAPMPSAAPATMAAPAPQPETRSDSTAAIPEIDPVTPDSRPALRRSTSLRHTGLLRPTTRVEPALHPQPSADESKNEAAVASDSVTQSEEPKEQSRAKAPVVDVHNDTDGGNDSAKEGDSDKKAETTL